jgi:hypothetical protein
VAGGQISGRASVIITEVMDGDGERDVVNDVSKSWFAFALTWEISTSAGLFSMASPAATQVDGAVDGDGPL